MNRPLTTLSVLVLVLGCAGAHSEEQTWSFVTAVGGLKVGTPVQSNGRWSLPIQADVAGLNAITNKPSTMKSGLVCKAVKAQVRGDNIFLVLETKVAHGTGTCRCPDAKLGRLADGSYDVW